MILKFFIVKKYDKAFIKSLKNWIWVFKFMFLFGRLHPNYNFFSANLIRSSWWFSCGKLQHETSWKKKSILNCRNTRQRSTKSTSYRCSWPMHLNKQSREKQIYKLYSREWKLRSSILSQLKAARVIFTKPCTFIATLYTRTVFLMWSLKQQQQTHNIVPEYCDWNRIRAIKFQNKN